MGNGGIPWGFGVRFLYDSHLRFFRPGLPCALRVQNYTTPEAGFAELGFQFTPSGAAQPEETGFTDIPIKPPVEVWSGGTKGGKGGDIGLNQARLMFYSRTFYVSHTFVVKRMNLQGYSDPYQVWRDPTVIGLYYENRLHKIESIDNEQIAGQILAWTLETSYQETEVTVEGS
jgi:hypothetical protein